MGGSCGAVWAARKGCCAFLRWAVEAGCPVHEETSWVAALHGHVDLVRYAVESGGSPWGGEISRIVRCRGYVDLQRWALAKGLMTRRELLTSVSI